jgi:glutathione-regulated potassium-efflux system ancillary protein KefC
MPHHTICPGPAADSAVQYPRERPRSSGRKASLAWEGRAIIDQGQYSALVAAVIASAVIPTVIANAFFLPHHLVPQPGSEKTRDEHEAAVPLRQVRR